MGLKMHSIISYFYAYTLILTLDTHLYIQSKRLIQLRSKMSQKKGKKCMKDRRKDVIHFQDLQWQILEDQDHLHLKEKGIAIFSSEIWMPIE